MSMQKELEQPTLLLKQLQVKVHTEQQLPTNACHANSGDADAKLQLLYTFALAMLQQVQQLRSHSNTTLVCKAALADCWSLANDH